MKWVPLVTVGTMGGIGWGFELVNHHLDELEEGEYIFGFSHYL